MYKKFIDSVTNSTCSRMYKERWEVLNERELFMLRLVVGENLR